MVAYHPVQNADGPRAEGVSGKPERSQPHVFDGLQSKQHIGEHDRAKSKANAFSVPTTIIQHQTRQKHLDRIDEVVYQRSSERGVVVQRRIDQEAHSWRNHDDPVEPYRSREITRQIPDEAFQGALVQPRQKDVEIEKIPKVESGDPSNRPRHILVLEERHQDDHRAESVEPTLPPGVHRKVQHDAR